jgi:hypothetical protein
MSLSYLQRESGLRFPCQLHVVLSPEAEALAEWHDYVQDWWAGEACPEMGLTVRMVSPSDSWDWVQSVICHEVAHLFFYQATYNALCPFLGTGHLDGRGLCPVSSVHSK